MDPQETPPIPQPSAEMVPVEQTDAMPMKNAKRPSFMRKVITRGARALAVLGLVGAGLAPADKNPSADRGIQRPGEPFLSNPDPNNSDKPSFVINRESNIPPKP